MHDESVTELFLERYGSGATPVAIVENDTIGTLLGHRSIRRFLPDEVSEAQVATMVAAAQSASTSSDVQAWSVIEVRDADRRASLADLSNNRIHVRQAPVSLVWVADLARNHALVEQHDGGAEAAVTGRVLEAGLVAFIDTALAAQNAAIAAESMGLGICYLGGVRNEPEQVSALLGLPQHTFALFGMCVGVPDPDQLPQRRPRLPLSIVRHTETYNSDGQLAGMAAFDETIATFDAGRGVDRGAAGRWTARMRHRLTNLSALHGRERLREQLRDQGFPLE